MTAKIEANPDEIEGSIVELRKQGGKLETMEKPKQNNDESLEQIREMQSRMQQHQSI